MDHKKLFRIFRDDRVGYDEYDSAVVVAESEESARMVHPSSYAGKWDGRQEASGSWVDADEVLVEYLGLCDNSDYDFGDVITASFNAG